MQVAAYKENTHDLAYAGNGIWEAKEIIPDFTREASWNGDTRFFVKMNIDGKEWKLANQKNFGDSKRLNIKLNCSPQEEFYYVYLEYLD